MTMVAVILQQWNFSLLLGGDFSLLSGGNNSIVYQLTPVTTTVGNRDEYTVVARTTAGIPTDLGVSHGISPGINPCGSANSDPSRPAH